MNTAYWNQFDKEYLDDMHGAITTAYQDDDQNDDHDDRESEENREERCSCLMGCNYCLML